MSRAAAHALCVSAPLWALAAACTTTTVDPAKNEYRVVATVDAQSAALQSVQPAIAEWPVEPGQPWAQGQDPAGQDPQQRGLDADRAAQLRARFGTNVLIKPDGRVTKQYFLSWESGGVLQKLFKEPGGAPIPPNKTTRIGAQHSSVLGRMLGEREVEVLYLENFETPEGIAIRHPVGKVTKPVAGASNSLLLVTAEPEALAAFEGALNLFFANIPQVEIEVKVVEYSTSDSLATGVDVLDPKAGTPVTLDQTSSKKLIQDITSRFPLSPPITGVGSGASRGLITLGGIHDNWVLNAQLQLLEARGVVDILSNPKMVVRNGGTASVRTTTELPYPQAKISSSGANVTANIVFRPVGITLHIRPVIAGTETVILQMFAGVSAVTDFAVTEPVSTPVISSREVTTSVHVTNGKTTVVGGLVSRSTIENETKMPILGDIPILGYLFRSRLETTTRTTLEFHITPRIIQGSRGFQGGFSDG